MTTTIIHVGKTITTDFHPEVPTYKQPRVLESYVNDEGETMLILDNGRETLSERYNAIWNPCKGKVITDKKYKGVNVDTTKAYLK